MTKISKMLENARAMAEAPSKGIGPEVVIVVNSMPAEAAYWQERLTGEDNIHASGAVIRRGAVVLSVTESNWQGPAGNALGTLNGFFQAAGKAGELGLISGRGEETDIFLEFLADKSVFMFHTAGRGMRVAPLAASELNSKSNIKLPGIINVAGKEECVTILESVIKMASIYAPSRRGRLGVFWGDQVIINENSIDLDGSHHVEIFGQLVPLDENIKSYGVLIPSGDGGCGVREKLDVASVIDMLGPANNKVYRSIGSFTISLDILRAFMDLERSVLKAGKGSLNTDPDWWQPLTSTREEYTRTMDQKGIDPVSSGARWDNVNSMWQTLEKDPAECGKSGRIGFTDVGEGSFWWDYGQNAYLFENIKLLTTGTEESRAARLFFGAEKALVKSSREGNVIIDDSLILNSSLKTGVLKRCVVVSSDIDSICAENSVIIGSDIIELNAEGALCYNVVSAKESLKEGDVAANIFHSSEGKIDMRTCLRRDGRADWENNEKVCDNRFTYKEIADIMREVSREEAERVKRQAAEDLRGKR
jgi:hypothetical protein